MTRLIRLFSFLSHYNFFFFYCVISSELHMDQLTVGSLQTRSSVIYPSLSGEDHFAHFEHYRYSRVNMAYKQTENVVVGGKLLNYSQVSPKSTELWTLTISLMQVGL